jgi:hypothetical protein
MWGKEEEQQQGQQPFKEGLRKSKEVIPIIL